MCQQQLFTWERRLKQDTTKGLGSPGGCEVDEEDYEPHKTWAKTSEVTYTYDEHGRRTLYEAKELYPGTQNRFTWSYDDQGRVVAYSSYDGPRLIWVEYFTYFPDSYCRTRTWYQADGTHSH
ncbi:hypothetical protein SAMN00120144_2137 [Hymenobacter roseosalivarius DSM 11622]|uniref:YD repeat protein n=1 Tax=Hymenobacter roseosalivarius DSM 11622 TaxID=645990 RepID=A0A1W1VG74_9BACT|nr:hypothetical protein [Hymenobacter roseosalivarius]SMB92352.1 hypothetical protein SAMN00120144_2137 [Hymenobacter roseosalivarius DSM 11622]